MLDIVRGKLHATDSVADAPEKTGYLFDRIADIQLDDTMDDEDIVEVDPEGDPFFPGFEYVKVEFLKFPAFTYVALVKFGVSHLFVGDPAGVSFKKSTAQQFHQMLG